MTLSEWLDWLETLSPHEVDLGLYRVRDVLARLGLPRPARVVHVAGTNGKGSTVALLERLYRAAGYDVAAYTSPHVSRYNERLRVGGRELDDDEIVAAFERVESVREDVPLTWFEFGTLAAFAAFADAGADAWMLEIGLGGRLDAVNALDPDGAVITNVSLDHCDWLGPDVESIAREKAGVMRPRIPVVFAGDAVPRAIETAAGSTRATLLVAGRDYRFQTTADGWRYAGRHTLLDGLAAPPLSGRFQLANAAGALALFEALEAGRLDTAFVDAAFAGLALAGRLERRRGNCDWLFDVAHNPAAAAALGAELAAEPRTGRLVAVLGVLADKDLDGMVAPLASQVDRWIAVPAESPRALAAVTLAARIAGLTGKPCRVATSVADGIAQAIALARADDLVVVSGSFYTVGPALAALRAQSPGLSPATY